ncbi:MAG: TetR/AcrR family transcriptional regulator [Hyphomicrobiaceae bacterium]
MPKLKPDTQLARREHILDAAERCFALSGFHRTTMSDICRDAHVSPGALYVYFASKEDLIAGITERDRSKLAAQLGDVAKSPDLMAALAALGEHYTVDEPRHKQQLVIEIGCQSMREGQVGEIFRSCDRFVQDQFEALFARAQADGKIAPSLDSKTLAQAVAVIGDGLFWRRAVDPTFDAKAIVPVVTAMIASLLNPLPNTSASQVGVRDAGDARATNAKAQA